MSNSPTYREPADEAPFFLRLLFLALSNGSGAFLMCCLLLRGGLAGGILGLIGLMAVPCVGAAVMARSTACPGSTPSRTTVSAGQFVLLLALGLAIEFATIWVLGELFWHSGPQWGA